MATQIQIRRGSTAAWTAANPILAEGELGLETDSHRFKFGDGVTAWADLTYSSDTGAVAWVDISDKPSDFPPAAHDQAASTITEDATHRFATDTEKSAWNAKQAALGFTPLDSTALDNDHTLAANSAAKVPSQQAVKAYADQLIASADAMVFKGVVDCSGTPNYPAADRGWTYRVSVAGKIGGASGVNVEVGDVLLCLTDSTVSGNQATVGTAWSIAQTNIDGAVVGPASASDAHVALFDGASGKLIKDGGALGNAAAKNTGTTAGTVAAGDDSRLTDPRTPTAHKATHATGQSDAIAPSDIGAQPVDTQLTSLAGLSYSSNALKVVRVNAGETDFELAASAGGSPAGSVTELQYRNAGAFGAMAGTAWDDTNRAETRTGATVTADHPVQSFTQTWNNSGVAFTGVKLNITDSASAATSLFADYQVAGSSKISFRKDGRITALRLSPQDGANFALSADNIYLQPAAASSTMAILNSTGWAFQDTASTTTTGIRWADVGIVRNAAGVVEVNSATAGTFRDLKLRNLIADNTIVLKSFTVGTLPSAATSGAGAMAYVTDSNQTLAANIGATVTAGGSAKMPVISDGTNWIIG